VYSAKDMWEHIVRTFPFLIVIFLLLFSVFYLRRLKKYDNMEDQCVIC
jgi:heme/copper-type cytochrome/quinol oxidase subunit 2